MALRASYIQYILHYCSSTTLKIYDGYTGWNIQTQDYVLNGCNDPWNRNLVDVLHIIWNICVVYKDIKNANCKNKEFIKKNVHPLLKCLIFSVVKVNFCWFSWALKCSELWNVSSYVNRGFMMFVKQFVDWLLSFSRISVCLCVWTEDTLLYLQTDGLQEEIKMNKKQKIKVVIIMTHPKIITFFLKGNMLCDCIM